MVRTKNIYRKKKKRKEKKKWKRKKKRRKPSEKRQRPCLPTEWGGKNVCSRGINKNP
jgi:hypothetical protein